MRIVHVLTRLLKAGSEENTIETCKGQSEQGHEVTLIHGADYDPDVVINARQYCKQVLVCGYLKHKINISDDIRATRQLARMLAMLDPHVVHTHQSKAGVIGRVAAALVDTPAIVHGVHIVPFENAGLIQRYTYVSAERICSRFTDSFINVSPSVRDQFISARIGEPRKHFVAYSGMNVDRFASAALPEDWREITNVRQGGLPPVAVMLAAFEPRKRHLEFINALPEAMSSISDWRLIFAGRGPLEQECRSLVASLGLSEKVRFVGHRSDPERIIALADVCVLTSHREGLPRVVIQYAAAKKPMVVTEVAGLKGFLTDGYNAILAPAEDVPAAARLVADVLGNESRRQSLIPGLIETDTSLWRPETMNRNIMKAYQAALALRSDRRSRIMNLFLGARTV